MKRPSFRVSSRVMAVILGAGILTMPLLSQPVFAQALPSVLRVRGTITGTPIPNTNDIVEVVLPTNFAVQGTGTVLDSSGAYFVEMSKPESFNGTVLTMLLTTGGAKYQLLNNDTAVSFTYSGGALFPSNLTLGLTVGDQVSSAGGGDGDGDGNAGGDASYDVNGDGSVNYDDLSALQSMLRQGRQNTSGDVNGDGIFNTSDMVSLSKYLQSRKDRFGRLSTTDSTAGDDSGDGADTQ